MKTKGLFLITLAVAIAMAGFALVTADHLPSGTMLATHWNAAGKADGFMPALSALLFPAGLLVLIGGLFAVIPRIEPLQDQLQSSAPVLRIVWIGMIALMAGVQLMIGLPVWGISPPVSLIPVAVGALLVVLGNVLPKSRPGFFVGIRTPWTITSEDNWIATHRLGGRLMMLAGVAIIAVGLLSVPPGVEIAVMIGAVLAAAVVPMLYSWWVWQRTSGPEREGH